MHHAGRDGCEPPAPDNHIDAIVAFDRKTGAIAWATHTLTADTWTGLEQFGPDFDFGSAPNLFTTVIDGTPTDLLGIGQKSGLYWVLDPATGKVVWRTGSAPAAGRRPGVGLRDRRQPHLRRRHQLRRNQDHHHLGHR